MASVKSTWFSDKTRHQFCVALCDADYSMRFSEVFDGFLVCACGLCEQAANMASGNARCEKIEDEVKAFQKRVKKPEKLSEALGILVNGLTVTPSDFLGSVMMEMEQGDVAFRGQCFTPKEISILMAELTLADAVPELGRTKLLNECSCGGGSMIIQTSEILKRKGFLPWNYHWYANDVDWRCYAMTYIQTTLLGIPCVVGHGNTLSMKFQKIRRNMISVLHPERRASRASGAPAVTSVVEVSDEGDVLDIAADRILRQTSLFD